MNPATLAQLWVLVPARSLMKDGKQVCCDQFSQAQGDSVSADSSSAYLWDGLGFVFYSATSSFLPLQSSSSCPSHWPSLAAMPSSTALCSCTCTGAPRRDLARSTLSMGAALLRRYGALVAVDASSPLLVLGREGAGVLSCSQPWWSLGERSKPWPASLLPGQHPCSPGISAAVEFGIGGHALVLSQTHAAACGAEVRRRPPSARRRAGAGRMRAVQPVPMPQPGPGLMEQEPRWSPRWGSQLPGRL